MWIINSYGFIQKLYLVHRIFIGGSWCKSLDHGWARFLIVFPFFISDFDECESSPCLNEGTCFSYDSSQAPPNQIGQIICQCADGYEDPRCGTGDYCFYYNPRYEMSIGLLSDCHIGRKSTKKHRSTTCMGQCVSYTCTGPIVHYVVSSYDILCVIWQVYDTLYTISFDWDCIWLKLVLIISK